MKLLNRSLFFTSLSVLAILSVWAVVFYFNMIDEVYDSIDDGLDNHKLLIMQKAAENDAILSKNSFGESNYAITPINRQRALQMRDLHKDTMMFMQFEGDMEPVRILTTAFEQNGRYYQLQVISSMVEEDDLIETLFWAIVWLYVVLIVSIVVVNNLLLRRIWKPFYVVLEQLNSFRLEHKQVPPAVASRTDEFIELKTAADRLIAQSIKTYSKQKEFMENAAHELQTPLAVMTNKIELLLEAEELNQQQAQALEEVLQQIGQLKQMNASLMLLTKIENHQVDRSSQVAMDELAQRCISDLEDMATFRQITIHYEGQANTTISMDAALARILVVNLLKNAIHHSSPESTVELSLQQQVLEVRNPSQGAALDPKVFERFFKGSAQRSNTGLGLSIVKAICDLYTFQLSYSHRENTHCFKIVFQ